MATIINYQPPAGTPISANTAVSFDVIDASIDSLLIFVWVVFADGVVELSYDNAAFQPYYSYAQITSITGGWRFAIQRVGGWPSTPDIRVETRA